jgi:hypothetical protein
MLSFLTSLLFLNAFSSSYQLDAKFTLKGPKDEIFLAGIIHKTDLYHVHVRVGDHQNFDGWGLIF